LACPSSYAVALKVDGWSAATLERRLRTASPPIIGRIEDEEVFLDLRTVLPEEIPLLVQVLSEMLGEGEG